MVIVVHMSLTAYTQGHLRLVNQCTVQPSNCMLGRRSLPESCDYVLSLSEIVFRGSQTLTPEMKAKSA